MLARSRIVEVPREREGNTRSKIVIDGVSKIFGARNGVRALDDFSLTVAEGEFLCILGPSGCGKTTALRILAGLETASSGTVSVERGGDRSRPLNSMVFQEHGLYPWMTVADNVAFGLEMRGMPRRQRLASIEPFLSLIGLTQFRGHYPHQLSGGMRQRVSLARAFVNDPEILLMDEPFGALDAHTRLLMQAELLRIWERDRKTVIFITHAIDEAISLGDRIVVMTGRPGRIRAIRTVPFPRPRQLPELRSDPRFGDMTLDLWRLLEHETSENP